MVDFSMASKKKNEDKAEIVVADTNTALAPVIDYGDDVGAGVDDISTDEAGIPFIKILQAQSPEVIGPVGKIEGAVAGMFLNTGTGSLADTINIVPAMRQHVYVEWRDKKAGGGVVALHQPGTAIVEAAIAANAKTMAEGGPSRKKQAPMKFGEFYTEEGNALVETFYVYAMLTDEDGGVEGFAVIPFTSTGIKKYKKKFINRVRYTMVTNAAGKKKSPPMFAHRVTLTTEVETNDDGTWFAPDLQFAVDNNVILSLTTPDNEGYQAGRDLKAMIDDGMLRADLSKADAGTDGGGTEEDLPF